MTLSSPAEFFFDNQVKALEHPFYVKKSCCDKKHAVKLLNDIYNIVYWMSGSKEKNSHLVYRTYLKVSFKAVGIEVFKTNNTCTVIMKPSVLKHLVMAYLQSP